VLEPLELMARLAAPVPPPPKQPEVPLGASAEFSGRVAH